MLDRFMDRVARWHEFKELHYMNYHVWRNKSLVASLFTYVPFHHDHKDTVCINTLLSELTHETGERHK